MKVDFLKYRFVYIIISILVIVGGISYGLATGYRYDIDFKGGTKIEVDLKESFENNDVSDLVKNVTDNVPIVQKMSAGESSVMITTEPISDDVVDEIIVALKDKYSNMDEPSTRNVQPSYGKELINSTILSISIAIILLLVYIGVRFKILGYKAAFTAIISQTHDVLFLVAIYGIIKFPINSIFIAVALTIIGYSINGTIIIYDRIRENKRRLGKSKNLKEVINESILQTMNRTIYSTITTALAIATVLVYSIINGQQILIEFSLPLLIGVMVGAYSSMFIATSSWYMLDNIKLKEKENKK